MSLRFICFLALCSALSSSHAMDPSLLEKLEGIKKKIDWFEKFAIDGLFPRHPDSSEHCRLEDMQKKAKVLKVKRNDLIYSLQNDSSAQPLCKALDKAIAVLEEALTAFAEKESAYVMDWTPCYIFSMAGHRVFKFRSECNAYVSCKQQEGYEPFRESFVPRRT
jgi:hypothetical protein